MATASQNRLTGAANNLPHEHTTSSGRWAHRVNWLDIKVCMETTEGQKFHLRNAEWIATALGLHITLFQVVSPDAKDISPIDPVGWEKRCREAQARLETIAKEAVDERLLSSALVVECPSPDKVCAVVPEAVQSLVSVYRGTGRKSCKFSDAARCFIENPIQSLLVVPDEHVAPKNGGSTIIALVDATPRSLKTCELASQLAESESRDVQLIQVIPKSEKPGAAKDQAKKSFGIDLGSKISTAVEVQEFNNKPHHWLELLRHHKPAAVLVQDAPDISPCTRFLMGTCPCPLLVVRAHDGNSVRPVQPTFAATGIRLPDGAEQ